MTAEETTLPKVLRFLPVGSSFAICLFVLWAEYF